MDQINCDCLLTKTRIWGTTIGDDAVCFTQYFLVEQGDLINTAIGGRGITTRQPIQQIYGFVNAMVVAGRQLTLSVQN